MKRRILVVDDENEICDFFSTFFEEAGYETEVAHNGKEALEHVQAHKPDVILLDIFMPVMDGLTFLTTFRREKGSEEVPVIVLSGFYQEEALEGLNISSFLRKPVDFSVVLNEVERSLV